jgi:hypothetical protein
MSQDKRQRAHRHDEREEAGRKPQQAQSTHQPARDERPTSDGIEQLRASPVMARLLDALEEGTDIGHYGRLVFVIVARHFLSEEEMLALLKREPDHDERELAGLIRQVSEHDYSPPSRARLLEWQAQQDFQLLPDAEDPAAGNLYRELRFPDEVYEHIEEFYEERAEAEDETQA